MNLNEQQNNMEGYYIQEEHENDVNDVENDLFGNKVNTDVQQELYLSYADNEKQSMSYSQSQLLQFLHQVNQNNDQVDQNNDQVDQNNDQVDQNNDQVDQNSNQVDQNSNQVDQNNNLYQSNEQVAEQNGQALYYQDLYQNGKAGNQSKKTSINLLESVKYVNVSNKDERNLILAFAAEATKSREEHIEDIKKYDQDKLENKMMRLLEYKPFQNILQHKYNIIYYLLIINPKKKKIHEMILNQYIELRVKWIDKLNISKDQETKELLTQFLIRIQENKIKEIIFKDSQDYFTNPNYQIIDFIQITINLIKVADQIQSENFYIQFIKGYSDKDLNEILEIIQNLLSKICTLREKKNHFKRQINFTSYTFRELVRIAKTEIEDFIKDYIKDFTKYFIKGQIQPDQWIPNNERFYEILKILNQLKDEVQQKV